MDQEGVGGGYDQNASYEILKDLIKMRKKKTLLKTMFQFS